MHEGHYYMIRTAPQTFTTKVLFIDWLQTVCRSWVETRWQKMHYVGLVVFLLNGHANDLAPSVIAYPGSERISVIQLVAHSSRLI
jgi:hypothetical protein